MLYYPPPSRGPLFQFLGNKGFLESPDQQLSLELYLGSFPHTHTNTQMWRLQKCSTIPPLLGAHCVSF